MGIRKNFNSKADIIQALAATEGATEENLRNYFKQSAKNNKEKMIVVNCTRQSPHGLLVRCLDALRESGLHNVSIFTL